MGLGDLVNVLDPFLVRVEGVGTQSDELDTSLVELGLELGERTELGSVMSTQQTGRLTKGKEAQREKGVKEDHTSVVQTGVKSSGWENKTTQLSPIKSWNLMGPFVVSASKSGAVLPNLNFFCSTPSTAEPIFCFFAGGGEILAPPLYRFVRRRLSNERIIRNRIQGQ
jgi:hypothetical protein